MRKTTITTMTNVSVWRSAMGQTYADSPRTKNVGGETKIMRPDRPSAQFNSAKHISNVLQFIIGTPIQDWGTLYYHWALIRLERHFTPFFIRNSEKFNFDLISREIRKFISTDKNVRFHIKNFWSRSSMFISSLDQVVPIRPAPLQKFKILQQKNKIAFWAKAVLETYIFRPLFLVPPTIICMSKNYNNNTRKMLN